MEWAINDLTMDLGNPSKEATMDEYDKKFAEMQKYIPFLEAMIERLQKVKDKSREAQLQKMQSLHGILSNSKRKLRIETLQRCEDVLQKLHNKVEKGNATGINTSQKKLGENSSQNNVTVKDRDKSESTALSESQAPKMMMENETPASPSPPASPAEHASKSTPIIIPTERSEDTTTRNVCKCDSKPASPDQCENIPVTTPIIIPTERRDDCGINEQQRINANSNLNLNNCGGSDSNNELFSEWDMLEESEKQINNSRRTSGWQSHLVSSSGNDPAPAKYLSNNLAQKIIPESSSGSSRPQIVTSRHIPAAPSPTIGGLRRIISVFEKNRLSGGVANAASINSEAKPQSPVNPSEIRLKSPDPDILFPRLKITSPRHKADGVMPPKSSPKPSTPLLVSPPSVLTEPPLSIEDLAELLSDETDAGKKDNNNKVDDSGAAIGEEQRSKTAREASSDGGVGGVVAVAVSAKIKNKETTTSVAIKGQQKTSKETIANNESKISNSFLLTQEDIDRESDRRWEEVDKHIVKLTTRRCLPNKNSISPLSTRIEAAKISETKDPSSRISQPLLSPVLANNNDKSNNSADATRNCPQSPLLQHHHNTMAVNKEKENAEKEHRYADNYERHPRQFRDPQDSGEDNNKDRNQQTSSIINPSRTTDEQQLGFQSLKSEGAGRNAPLYQRRSQANVSVDGGSSAPGRNDDYRRENNADYFVRNANKRPPLLPSPIIPDFSNNQWGSTPSYSGNIRPPPPVSQNAYQRISNNANFHQDICWQQSAAVGVPPPGMPAEYHQINESESRVPPQFNPHPAIRSSMNPAPPRSQEMSNHGLNPDNNNLFREEVQTGPTLVNQSLLSPSGFPTGGPQYRGNPRMENRPYDPSFDRSSDISQTRHTWDSSSTRVSDVGYRRDAPDPPRGRSTADGPPCRPGTPAPYPRPSTPSPLWSRDRERTENKDWSRRGGGGGGGGGGRGRERYYNDRGSRPDSRGPFVRDSRRSEWEREGHGERDNRAAVRPTNKDNRVSERDPRVRSEQRAPSPVQPKETVVNTAATVRDPRLIKDALNVAEKAKEIAAVVVGPSPDKNLRRRSCEAKGVRKGSPGDAQTAKGKEKTKNQKVIDSKNRKDSETDDKDTVGAQQQDKSSSKDKLHSPLESLYGVIDTKAKAGQGYGLQKFKIPKIKRPDPPPPAAKTDQPNSEVIKTSESVSSVQENLSETTTTTDQKTNIIDKEKAESDNNRNKEKSNEEIERKDDSTNIPSVNTVNERERPSEVVTNDEPDNEVSQETLQTGNNFGSEIGGGAATSGETDAKESVEQSRDGEGVPKESDTPKPKEEVTKEWIEALIRKSFEFGQGKQLFDQAKLLHKLGEVFHAKKLKKIKKIIESDSETSSSSKEEEIIESRKLQTKKKRRVIFSDSSEEESLADRLCLLKDSISEQSTSNQPAMQEIDQNTTENAKEGKEEADNENGKDDGPEVESKTDVENKLETSDNDDEDHGTSVETEKAVVPTVKKKRAYKRRGKGPKKKATNVEEPGVEESATNESLNESKEDSNVVVAVSEDDKAKEKAAAPPAKIKNKRRNSLEMLQEDIREMFISEGVVTATGHRMCRLLKEGNGNLNSSVQNLPNSSGYISEKRTRAKQNASANSETDETSLAESSKKDDFVALTRAKAKSTAKSSQAETRGDTQRRASRRSSKVVSRQFVDSSDSEEDEDDDEDEPLMNALTPSESLKSFYDPERALGGGEENDIGQKSESQNIEESQEMMFLRRSKRIPRVIVEKTEFPKTDASKMMFDSFSDDSFGIDVSELAAAVDISLHPEPQSPPDTESIGSPKPSRRKTRLQTNNKLKQTSSRRNRSSKTLKDKADDAMSFTDEGSILSDNSISSSIASLKKVTRNSTTKGLQDTNEELLSNLLIGLTAKSTPEKSTVDRESDIDADEELDENTCETSEEIKKGVTKRKRKKFNWQLGILSKKRKKKKKPSAANPVLQVSEVDVSSEILNECLDGSDRQIDGENADADAFDLLKNTRISGSSNKNYDLEDDDEISIVQQSASTTEPHVDLQSEFHSVDTIEDSEKLIKPLPKTPRKRKRNKGNKDENLVYNKLRESEDGWRGITQISSFHDTKSFEIKKLIEHAWSGLEKYRCMLCAFVGKNIVHHYKLTHPKNEVLISRLTPADAELAIEESNKNDGMQSAGPSSSDEKECMFICRICMYHADGKKEIAKEVFYEHCTTHTGEYRFKCASCPYQTVARSSLKSHYYKVCRKQAENVAVAVIEDDIPEEDVIYGYICSCCNYLQLKKSNVEDHLISKHHKNSGAKVIRINMSLPVKGESSDIGSKMNVSIKENAEDNKELLSSMNEKDEEDRISERGNRPDDIVETTDNLHVNKVEIKDIEEKKEGVDESKDDDKEQISGEINIGESSNVIVPKDEELKRDVATTVDEASADMDIMEVDDDGGGGKNCEEELEALPVNGNLSAFVCPPEIAIKEYEIQLERKKKMQEVIEDIGIKVNKGGANKSPSIIDKLKDIMDTNSMMMMNNSEENVAEKNLDEGPAQPFGKPQPKSPDKNLAESIVDEKVAATGQASEFNTVTNSSFQVTNCVGFPSPLEDTNKTLNSSEPKIKDPLATFDDASQNFCSDTETSDAEIPNTFVEYESDSSNNEQSESQISQDVNSLLEETTTTTTTTTSDNNVPGKGRMLITIQRLAAQLQNAKTGCSPNHQLSGVDEAQIKIENIDNDIPKAPNVVPLSSIKRLLDFKSFTSEEIKQSEDQSEEMSPPKTLIRIRRLSGDKLSVPSNPAAELQEENPLSSTDGSASDLGTGVLQTDTEEECSFLRIENVVSLAPSVDNEEAESSFISNIRKAVEISPVKSPRISILKKSPIILQKVGNRSVLNQRLMSNINSSGESVKIIPVKSLPSTSQTPKQVLANIVPVQSTSKIQVSGGSAKKSVLVPAIVKKTNNNNNPPGTITGQMKPAGNLSLPVKQNFKIIKLTKTATVLKHRECVAESKVIKLKSPEAYRAMLKPAKLCHIFKCMARNCSYTTNSLEYFKNHYNEHFTISTKDNIDRPFGCQYCAYCGVFMEDWNAMEKHLLGRHAFCKYQCSYCFFRALSQSYVELHQAVSHIGHAITVYQGKSLTEKIPENFIDRNETVKPFICQQECGKTFYIPEAFITHLKIKHGPLLSIYKCHLCPATSLKPEQLVSHYKLHGISNYQCMYCLNGADMSWELHNHLSNFHYNRPPLIIERNLPPQASTTQDVINQLIVRNVEDEFKFTDLVTDVEEIAEENWQLTTKPANQQSSSSSNDKNKKINEISTDKLSTDTFIIEKDKAGKISVLRKNLLPRFSDTTADNYNSETTAALHSKDGAVSITDVEKFDKYYSLVNIVESLVPDKSIDKNKSVDKEPPEGGLTFEFSAFSGLREKRDIVNKTPKRINQMFDFGRNLSMMVDSSSVDPLNFSENSSSSNSAKISSNSSLKNVDNNVANSDVLKKFVKDGRFDVLVLPKDNTAASKNNANDDCDDSDIEILEENIGMITKKAASEKEAKEIASKDDDDVRTIGGELKIEETRQEEPVVDKIPENVAQSGNINAERNAAESTNDATIKQQQQQLPLSLDDIRDTGFTGNNLYKCGNDDCDFNAETAELLKNHLTNNCTVLNESKSLICAHCKKRFVKVGFLLEHLKTHGLKRFGCSLCSMRCTMPYQAMSHMKSKHKFGTNKLVPADPRNPSTDGLFVVQPIRGALERGKGKKRTPTKGGGEKEVEKCILDVEKPSFKPDEIESLPRQAIYNREVLCAVCPYTTKVRTNMIRHLQLHAKDETVVPESGPVNPVPCLDKKERMFDKMVNLASSSHQNGRMGGKPRDNNSKENQDEASLPKYVPEYKRYVCGVAECNYLTVDDTMLRCHLKALHSDEPYFRCPHCPTPIPGQETQNIGIDKMGIHLKMHDTRLYKCSHCNHHHYHRHVVERHLSDKHAEKRPFVKVIREPESCETATSNQQAVQDDGEDEGPDRDGNHWKCNICEYKCIYKNEMISHASTEHDERLQFKCTECPYKTSGKINFEQHFVSRHPSEPQVKYDMVYQKIKGGIKRSAAGGGGGGESVDQTGNEEPFDTTPLWRRDMPRVRHIRGILLEDEEAAAAVVESTTKGTKRKSEGVGDGRPTSKLKSSKSSNIGAGGEMANKFTDDIKIRTLVMVGSKTPEKRKEFAEGNITPNNERVSKIRAVDKLRLLDKSLENDRNQQQQLEGLLGNSLNDTTTSLSEDFSELSDSDMGQFGPYGKPKGIMFVCTLCNFFETRYKHDLRDHLYRELKYKKWHCRACGFLFVNRHTLVKHINKRHVGEQPDYEMLTPDNSIEDWVNTLLRRQANMIKGITNKSNSRTSVDKLAQVEKTPQVKLFTEPNKPERDVSLVAAQAASLGTSDDHSKTVDLTEAISSLKDGSIDPDMDVDDDDDEDSRDNDDLVIDLKDDTMPEEADKAAEEKSTTRDAKPRTGKKEVEKILSCKHCDMKFARWRGFKVHVQVTHLKRLAFLCPHCDRSTNSEVVMRQHIRAKHPGSTQQVVPNPSPNSGKKLTREFWEKEYGLVFPKKKQKKQQQQNSKQQTAVVVNNNKSDANNAAVAAVEEQKKSDDPPYRDICNLCGFTAFNFAGLKAHMRIHSKSDALKCAYCTFSGSIDSEIWHHWRSNHPQLPFKIEDISSAAAGPSNENKEDEEETEEEEEEEKASLIRPEESGISIVEEYNDDIEEEQVGPVPGVKNSSEKSIYCCCHCNLRSSALATVKKHWEMVHKEAAKVGGVSSIESSRWKTGLPFKYKEIRVPIPQPVKILHCGYCNKKGGKATLRVHMRRKHGELPPMFAEVPREIDKESFRWICQWCNEVCESEIIMKNHHTMFHSHLPQHFKKQQQQQQQQEKEKEKEKEETNEELEAGYHCPDCGFSTVWIQAMKKHLGKHINLYKCKYCETTLATPALVASHSAQMHEGLELKIESISDYNLLVKKMMSKVKWVSPKSPSKLSPPPPPPPQLIKSETITELKTPPIKTNHHYQPKKHAVAKKSTAKPLPGVQSRNKIRSVARKSTNSLSRYPAGFKFGVNTNAQCLESSSISNRNFINSSSNKSIIGYSYYGLPSSPISLASLSTYMSVGGHQMKVNCTTLGQLMNINPRVLVKDVKHDLKKNSSFSY